MKYRMVVIGASSGGIKALETLLRCLEEPLPIPLVIIQHLEPTSATQLPELLRAASGLRVREIDDKLSIEDGMIYTAPPNYHVLMEKDWSFSLNVDEKVSYARPSIDVFMESAADAVKEGLIGVVLTGGNHDGTLGIKAVKLGGGFTMVQSPDEAESPTMPRSALEGTESCQILTIHEIAAKLVELSQSQE